MDHPILSEPFNRFDGFKLFVGLGVNLVSKGLFPVSNPPPAFYRVMRIDKLRKILNLPKPSSYLLAQIK